jgi:hypothetical protein
MVTSNPPVSIRPDAQVKPIAPLPRIEASGYPVTVYLTTYYAEFNRPVYDAMVSYLLWKGRERALHWPEVLGPDASVALTADGRRAVGARLRQRAIEQGLSGRDKDAFLAGLAARLGVDYDDILRRRLLHLMTCPRPAGWHDGESICSFTRTGTECRSTKRLSRAKCGTIVSGSASFATPSPRTSAIPAASIDASSCRGCATAMSRRRRPARPAWRHAATIPLLLPRYIDTARHTEAEFR